MLSQPVLDKVKQVLSNGNLGPLDGVHDTKMSVPVVCNVMGTIHNPGEHGLLIPEVLIVHVNHVLVDSLVIFVSLDLPDSIKEDHMLIIKVLVASCERLFPDIGFGHGVEHSPEHLALVGVVSVLDVLDKPVLGPVGDLLAKGD